MLLAPADRSAADHGAGAGSETHRHWGCTPACDLEMGTHPVTRRNAATTSPMFGGTDLASTAQRGIKALPLDDLWSTRPAFAPAPPVVRRRLRRRRSRRLALKHVARRLVSPISVVIIVGILAGYSYETWVLFEQQRLERLLSTPRRWSTATVQGPVPAVAALTTSHRGSFLHYEVTVASNPSDPTAVEAISRIDFTIRLSDKDGFTLLVIKPEALTLDAGRKEYRLRAEGVIGCSASVYAATANWSIVAEGG